MNFDFLFFTLPQISFNPIQNFVRQLLYTKIAAMTFKTTATIASFGGQLLKLSHPSKTTACEMKLNLYLPPTSTSAQKKIPVLFYLAGLTCTGDNGAEKGFFQYGAAKHGIAVVYPDTSPRNTLFPFPFSFRTKRQTTYTNAITGGVEVKGSEDSWDFGTGAGFYINATTPDYKPNYQMESYITSELPSALFAAFPQLDSSRVSISGHSMGGHGALTLFLKNPGMYKSVSAFAPIANPTKCPWGEKAFTGYLGEDKATWAKHDATELVKAWKGDFDALIDVGTGDQFYKDKQLLPENFAAAAKESGNDKGLVLRYQDVSCLFIFRDWAESKASRCWQFALRVIVWCHLRH